MELPNTVAYYDTATITAVKGVIVQAIGAWIEIQAFDPRLTTEEYNHYATGGLYYKSIPDS